MQDPRNYANPSEFQAFRFVTERDGVVTSTSRLSHPSPLFPFWGSVGRSWCVFFRHYLLSIYLVFADSLVSPARFYVSMVVKMILVHIIQHYDIKLANEDAKPHFSWGVNLVTHPGLAFLIRERKKVSV